MTDDTIVTSELPHRVALKGARNVRDLGGYPIASGGKVRRWKLFRADALAELSDTDVSVLLGLGLRTVIDLRDPEEIAAAPDVGGLLDAVECHRIPLLAGLADGERLDETPATLGDFYVLGARYCARQFRDVFTIIAGHTEGALLFHCTAGKDRTGMVAALLYGLVDVSRAAILADYRISGVYLSAVIERLRVHIREMYGRDGREDFLSSDRIHMERFLDFVYDEYGGAEGYLRFCGVDRSAIAALKELLVGGPP